MMIWLAVGVVGRGEKNYFLYFYKGGVETFNRTLFQSFNTFSAYNVCVPLHYYFSTYNLLVYSAEFIIGLCRSPARSVIWCSDRVSNFSFRDNIIHTHFVLLF